MPVEEMLELEAKCGRASGEELDRISVMYG
jgi:hypothetical protein